MRFSAYAARPTRGTANRRRRSARLAREDVLADERGRARPARSTRRRGDSARARRPTAARVRPRARPLAAPRAARASAAARSPRRCASCSPSSRFSVSCRSSSPTSFPPRGIVPHLVREALDVVRQIAGQLDDRGAEAWRRAELGGAEPRLDELGEAFRGDLLQAHDRSGLVERPATAEHPLHQARLGPREHVADLPLVLHRGAQRVLDVCRR